MNSGLFSFILKKAALFFDLWLDIFELFVNMLHKIVNDLAPFLCCFFGSWVAGCFLDSYQKFCKRHFYEWFLRSLFVFTSNCSGLCSHFHFSFKGHNNLILLLNLIPSNSFIS